MALFRLQIYSAFVIDRLFRFLATTTAKPAVTALFLSAPGRGYTQTGSSDRFLGGLCLGCFGGSGSKACLLHAIKPLPSPTKQQ